MRLADWVTLFRYMTLITGIGLSFIVPVLLGWWLGATLQAKFLWGGWLPIAIIAGIIAGGLNVYALLKMIVPWE